MAFARNRALKEAKGEILAFIDDDCEAITQWVEKIMKVHKGNPKAAAIQGKTLSMSSNSASAIIIDAFRARLLQHKTRRNRNLFVCDIRNISFKVRVLRKLGISFHGEFQSEYHIDLAKQLIRKKQHIIYDPSILNYGRKQRTFIEVLKEAYNLGGTHANIDYQWLSYLSNELTKVGPHIKSVQRTILQKASIFRRPLLAFILQLYGRNYKRGYKDMIEKLLAKGFSSRIKPHTGTSVSVAIVTRNRANSLKRLLWSLSKQTAQPSEVVIIDNGSTDKTRETVFFFRRFLPIAYYYESQIGIPYARNRALKEARGEIIAFIDDDCEAGYHWVEKIRDAHKKFSKTVAIQGITKSLPVKSIFSMIVQPFYRLWFENNTIKANRLLICDTKNLSLKRNLLKSLHIAFDASFPRGSDVDFAKKLITEGQEIISEPSIYNAHWERSTVFSFLKQYTNNYD